MTKPLLIASDLHGSVTALRALIDRSHAHQAASLLFAGDLCPTDDPLFAPLWAQLPQPVIVRGNSDSSWAFSRAKMHVPPQVAFSQWEGRKILIYHGDIPLEPQSFGLRPKDIVVSGHTHIPHLYIDDEGIVQINGGSLASPRSRWGSTYATLFETRATIHRLEDGDRLFSLNLSER